MTDTVFNPDTFMSTETTDANATRMVPVPEGEYTAVVNDVKADTIGQDSRPVLKIQWEIQDDDGSVKAATGMETNRVEQLIFLDLTAQGGLDAGEGKNVQLGRLRKAVGQNQPGQPWAPSYLNGQVARIQVGHRVDKNDPEIKYAGVKRVDAMS